MYREAARELVILDAAAFQSDCCPRPTPLRDPPVSSVAPKETSKDDDHDTPCQRREEEHGCTSGRVLIPCQEVLSEKVAVHACPCPKKKKVPGGKDCNERLDRSERSTVNDLPINMVTNPVPMSSPPRGLANRRFRLLVSRSYVSAE